MIRMVKVIAIGLAFIMLYWGWMNAAMPEPPYGWTSRYVGYFQIMFGALLLYMNRKLGGRLL